MRAKHLPWPGVSHLVAGSDDMRDAACTRNSDQVLRSEWGTNTAIILLQCALKCLESDRIAASRCLNEALVLLGARMKQARMMAPAEVNDFPPGGLERWQVSRALAYIEENLDLKVGVHELAAYLSLSESHFSHAFKKSLGLPPMAYVVKRRVERAKTMMISTAFHLTDVALACGFADQSHFTRSFHRLVGVSPGVWRRTNSVA